MGVVCCFYGGGGGAGRQQSLSDRLWLQPICICVPELTQKVFSFVEVPNCLSATVALYTAAKKKIQKIYRPRKRIEVA